MTTIKVKNIFITPKGPWGNFIIHFSLSTLFPRACIWTIFLNLSVGYGQVPRCWPEGCEWKWEHSSRPSLPPMNLSVFLCVLSGCWQPRWPRKPLLKMAKPSSAWVSEWLHGADSPIPLSKVLYCVKPLFGCLLWQIILLANTIFSELLQLTRNDQTT